MQESRLKNYLLLHLIVFIWGFTAILGALITVDAIPLVWFRMSLAVIIILLYFFFKKKSLKVDNKGLVKFFITGVIIALHWITFFEAINQANVSITLAMFSSGAFFASLIEPVFFKRRILGYEIIFGIIVILGVFLITSSEMGYINGIVLGLLSALLSTLFAVINGLFIEKHNATVISFYEFVSGVFFITVFILLTGKSFNAEFFILSNSDWMYLFILASVCTAYAFIGSVDIMRYISPFTVILSYNLEPIYGIVIAILLFPDTEKMSPQFYLGAILIMVTVVFDAIFKNYKRRRIKSNSITN